MELLQRNKVVLWFLPARSRRQRDLQRSLVRGLVRCLDDLLDCRAQADQLLRLLVLGQLGILR
jgi:hypothetical protein